MPLLAAYVIIRPRWLIQKSNYIAKKKSFITVKTLVFIIFAENALLFLWKNLQWWEKVTILFTKVFLSAQLVNHRVFTIIYLFRLESHMECLEKKLIYAMLTCPVQASEPNDDVTKIWYISMKRNALWEDVHSSTGHMYMWDIASWFSSNKK